jgi:uncharacterized protein
MFFGGFAMPEMYYYFRDWFEGTYTLRIIDGFFDLLLKIGPYMIAGILISVATNRFFRRRKRLLFTVGNEFLAIMAASAVGLVSPLPTYAAIPVGLSLMPAGVPFSAVLAFAITSPLMNPTIFYLTAARLGMEMALARAVTAFIVGCIGGLLILTLFPKLKIGTEVKSVAQYMEPRPLWVDIWRTTLYTGRVFSVTLLISAAVKALIPAQAIVDLVGEHAAMGTLVAVGLGIPFYSCGGAAIPLVETMMELGMGKGATLAFFIAGPATKLETLYAFKTTMGGKVLLLYLGLTIAFACLAGTLYSMF